MNQMSIKELYYYYENKMQKILSPNRFAHSQRVVNTSIKLADKRGLDKDRVALAAIIHDRGKEIDKNNLVEIAERAGIMTDEAERYNPGVLHGPVGAHLLREEELITDTEILMAVHYHTTGRPAMSELEKVIFLADLIEPERNYPKADLLRRLSYKDFEYALIKALDWTLEFLLRKKEVINPLTIKTRNYYLYKDHN